MLINLKLTPEGVLAALEEDTPDRRPLMRRLEREAPVSALIGALELARGALTRELLCDLLGLREARTAVPLLLAALDDPEPGVRASAADALGKIVGYGKRPAPAELARTTAAAMLRHWEKEASADVRTTLVAALALTGDPDALAAVRDATVGDPDERVRDEAQYVLHRLSETAGTGERSR